MQHNSRDAGMSLSKAVSLLPTPSASSYGSNQGGAAGRTGKVRESLETLERNGRLPTPRANCYGAPDSHGHRPDGWKGCLNPRFVEWMMGFPQWWVADPALPPYAEREPVVTVI
jgi:hypothetical protein